MAANGVIGVARSAPQATAPPIIASAYRNRACHRCTKGIFQSNRVRLTNRRRLGKGPPFYLAY